METKTVVAINKKHQGKVNRALMYLERYDRLNTLRDIADGEGDEVAYKQLDRRCGQVFDLYLEIAEELPKRERSRIEKSVWY